MSLEHYRAIVRAKRKTLNPSGFDAGELHPSLFEHQRQIVRWSCRMGKCAAFVDTGLGKTRIQLEWARLVAEHTGGRVLILAPLAVVAQTLREAATMGIEAGHVEGPESIHVTNYERLQHCVASDYVGVVLDESSILKSYTGRIRTAIIETFARTPYRFALTATPAPNDHTELGNHAQFLGVCTRRDMMSEYFVHDAKEGPTGGWRLKGHAVKLFWEWVATWAVMVQKPHDLGIDDNRYDLPELNTTKVVIKTERRPTQGMLMALPASTLAEQREERRNSLQARVAAAAEFAAGDDPCVVWCELNAESSAAVKAIEGAVEVKGSDTPEQKADALEGFALGEYRVIVTKPKIAGFGLNWQHCSRMVFVGATHSYEQFYQAVRRCWRFGQTRPVEVVVITTPGDALVVQNLERKMAAAELMASEMVGHVKGHQLANIKGLRPGIQVEAAEPVNVPTWL